jgi:uncharacterized protein YeaO (DUF488 family)
VAELCRPAYLAQSAEGDKGSEIRSVMKTAAKKKAKRSSPKVMPDVRIALKRIYDKPDTGDGVRILVDRLWPRGLSTDKAAIDLWLRDIAPSDDLRKWFGHEPERWPAFIKRYRAELKGRSADLQPIRDAMKKGPVTLLFAAKDEIHNNAMVIKEMIETRARAKARTR